LARALFGQAVALDRAGRDGEARRIMGGRLPWIHLCRRLRRGWGDAGTDQPFLPSVMFITTAPCLLVTGDEQRPLDAFKQCCSSAAASRWRKRAEDHLLALASAGADAPPAQPRHGTVVASLPWMRATAAGAPHRRAWKSRPRLLEPCVVQLPANAPRILRVPLLLEIDGNGIPRRAGSHGHRRGFRAFERMARFRRMRFERASRRLALAYRSPEQHATNFGPHRTCVSHRWTPMTLGEAIAAAQSASLHRVEVHWRRKSSLAEILSADWARVGL